MPKYMWSLKIAPIKAFYVRKYMWLQVKAKVEAQSYAVADKSA